MSKKLPRKSPHPAAHCARLGLVAQVAVRPMRGKRAGTGASRCKRCPTVALRRRLSPKTRAAAASVKRVGAPRSCPKLGGRGCRSPPGIGARSSCKTAAGCSTARCSGVSAPALLRCAPPNMYKAISHSQNNAVTVMPILVGTAPGLPKLLEHRLMGAETFLRLPSWWAAGPLHRWCGHLRVFGTRGLGAGLRRGYFAGPRLFGGRL